MEINSYSQNTYYQTQTTSKAKNNNSAKLESFAEMIDTSNSVQKQPVVYDERAELARYPYYQMHPEAIEIEINYQHFVKKQEQLPWEEQLVFPTIAPELSDYFHYEELLKDDWVMAMRGVTNGNKYDGAPEFKAFVDKWMATGLSEDEALQRAGSYADAGLLDYGSQRASMYNNLPLTDTKQHGLWLIDNPPLKKAILEVFDSLNTYDLIDLETTIFYGGPENNNSAVQTSFQELLTKYGVKLEDLKQKDPQFAKDNPEVFSGDINLKNDNSAESQAYNNFIFKTIVGFFKDRIESLEKWETNHPEDNLSSTKESINLLIENFQEKVDEYNENITNGESIGKK
jgi:hypothetical protein